MLKALLNSLRPTAGAELSGAVSALERTTKEY
jgi:hypothetical protein